MEEFHKGDIVGRKSYGVDIYFKIINFFENSDGRKFSSLKGVYTRLCASAPLEDLVRIESGAQMARLKDISLKSNEQMGRIFSRRQRERELFLGRAVQLDKEPTKNSKVEGFDVPGTVLHIDGDEDYLDLCMSTYKQLNIPADGYNIPEEKQPGVVEELLKKHAPDMLVITGHDGFIKGREDFKDINNYYSSKYFVEAVKVARRYEKSKDDLVIFAGACQSHYESLLNAGANFASSPQRVMIHAYDPVFVIEKIAYTSIYDPISIKDIIGGTITGFDGIGGMESRGKFRLGIPVSPY
ncbi:MAG: sporulation peptidase YabG [Desulfotomaculaceae bacterium]|nr:sporulation peptidase YabG [Desulfotomaculaceae bacterium]